MQMQQQPARPSDPVKTTAIVLVVCSILILIGTFTKSWITAGEHGGSVNMGPSGIEVCMGSMCVSAGSAGGKLPGDIELFQTLALIGGIAAAAAAGIYGGMVLANKRDKLLPMKLGQGAFGFAAFSMTYFEIRTLTEGHGASIGWSVFPAIIGVIVAGVYLKKLSKLVPMGVPGVQGMPTQPSGQQWGGQPMQQQSQPMQPQYGQQQPMQPQQYGQQQPQMQQPPGPPPQAAGQQFCPRCGTPLHFVAQYQRWFCPKEQQYV